jgi:plasmid stabilization system protein ParE
MENEIIYEIVISQHAENNLDKIITYLLFEWNETVKNNFLNNFKRNLNLLSANPFIFQVYSPKKRIRKCLITKQNAMYYRIVDNVVEIITIHDTRRNTKTLKL